MSATVSCFSDDGRLALHIDTDEANAGNLGNGAQGFIEGIQEE